MRLDYLNELRPATYDDAPNGTRTMALAQWRVILGSCILVHRDSLREARRPGLHRPVAPIGHRAARRRRLVGVADGRETRTGDHDNTVRVTNDDRAVCVELQEHLQVLRESLRDNPCHRVALEPVDLG